MLLPMIGKDAGEQKSEAATSLIDKKIAIRDAAVSVKRGSLALNSVQYQREVKDILKKLPSDFAIGGNDMRLERAIHEIVSRGSSVSLPELKRAYTDTELRCAISARVCDGASHAEVEARFGVKERTTRDYAAALKEAAGKEDLTKKEYTAWCSSSEGKECIFPMLSKMEIAKAGAQKIIPVVERDLLALSADFRKSAGNGLDRRRIQTSLKLYQGETTAALLEESGGALTKEIRSLQKAKFSRHFIADNFQGKDAFTSLEGLPVANGKFTKDSDLSHQRTKALNPCLSSAMTKKYAAANAEMIRNGECPPTGPGAGDHSNWDEIGFGGVGDHKQTYGLTKPTGERSFREKTGEKNPLWVTVILGVIDDGRLLPPIIIHKGGGAGVRGDFALNLDPTFRLSRSPSGYATRDDMRLVAAVQAQCWPVSDGHEKITYFDGADGHHDATAQEYLLNHGYHPRFLRSHASTDCQPLDLGVNALVAAAYDEEYAMFQFTNPTEPLTPPIFNRLFTAAFNKVKNDPDTAGVIVRSFARAGLYPLVDIMAPDDDDEKNDPKRKAKFLQNTKLSAPYVTDPRDAQRINDLRTQIEQTPEVEVVVPDPTQPGQSAIRLTVAQPGTKEYGVLLRSAARQYFEKTYIVPVAANVQAREDERRMKKLRIPNGNADCLNPNTTTGLCVTKDIIERLREIEVCTDLKEKEKIVKQHATKSKAALVSIASQQQAEKVLAVYKAGGNAWKKSLVTDLKGAFKHFISKFDKRILMPKKKEDFISALQPVLAGHNNAADGPPVVDDDDDDDDENDTDGVHNEPPDEVPAAKRYKTRGRYTDYTALNADDVDDDDNIDDEDGDGCDMEDDGDY